MLPFVNLTLIQSTLKVVLLVKFTLCRKKFLKYRNDSNKRPGRLLDFSIFYLDAYSRWALIHYLIEF